MKNSTKSNKQNNNQILEACPKCGRKLRIYFLAGKIMCPNTDCDYEIPIIVSSNKK